MCVRQLNLPFDRQNLRAQYGERQRQPTVGDERRKPWPKDLDKPKRWPRPDMQKA